MDKEYISFDIKTGMKNIIGRDLITDDFIAIYELVKNSYDAYADYVTITFNDDEIIIADNGKGMSEYDIKEKWFAVAYSAKKDGSEDDDVKRSPHLNNLKSRRYYAGAKGVGRFSCDRLGNSLELTTTHISSDETYKIEIDWRQFELDAKQSFSSVQIPFEKSNPDLIYNNSKRHGTILRITRLNSPWNEKRLLDLKHSLEKIINPFSDSQNEFTIEIIADRFISSDWGKTPFQQINGKITNSILSVLNIKTTQINVLIKDELITTKLVDRGTLIYHIEENNPYAQYIEDLDISLYFLNRSAKINFGKIMDIEPVNYGNVLLFKNGFRVQPYGQFGDDSWKIDQRKQQGYNRRLGTRDLFGRVNITTENFEEFKEVSSRDGGLVETVGKKLLFGIFSEKAFGRLERYVVGVLWGEAFIRKNYFLDLDVAQKYRDKLTNDKDKDTYEDVKENLGSKIDFVNLIKSLSDEDVKIIDYNKDLVNLVNEQLDVVQPKFISDLEKIAERTSDAELLEQVKLTEENFNRIILEKDEAIKRAELEEQRRIDAEKKAKEEENKRIEAEKKQKEEELKRHQAELATANKEKERALAELAKLKAEQTAKEEAGKRIIAEKELDIVKDKNKYLVATRTTSKETDDILHTIQISSNELLSATKIISENISNLPEARKITKELDYINFHIERINKLSSLLTKADITLLKQYSKVDIPNYIKEYLPNYNVSVKEININNNFQEPFIRKTQLLDLSVIIDNLISNSKKANATKIYVDFERTGNQLFVYFSDNGDGVDLEKFSKESIFEEGITNRRGGSGIGLSTIRDAMQKSLNGNIEFLGNGLHFNTGATFRLKFQ